MDADEVAKFAADHVDKTVAELIGSRNYKQALKNLDKKKKKGNPAHANIVKAAIQCDLGDLDASSKSVNEVIATFAPPHAPDVLEILHTILCSLRDQGLEVKDKQLEDLWLKSIVAEKRQDDKVQIAQDWMFTSMQREQWNLVVKASQQLTGQKLGDAAEATKQWNIQTCARYINHLAKQQSTGQGSELDRRLALQILQKAAKDAPEPSEPTKSAGRWIATEKDLKLLAEVFRREGLSDELLDIFRQPKFEPLVQGNNEFIYAKVSLWEACPPEIRMAAEAWTNKLLNEASGEGGRWLRDDWNIWRLLSRSHIDAVRLDESKKEPNASTDQEATGLEEAFNDLVITQTPDPPMNRASALAQLDSQLMSPSAEFISDEYSAFDACLDFFVNHADSDWCASDLTPRVRSFTGAQRLALGTAFHEKVDEMKKDGTEQQVWLQASINALSIDCMILDDQRESASNLRQYAQTCLKTWDLVDTADIRQRQRCLGLLENVDWALTRIGEISVVSDIPILKCLLNTSYDSRRNQLIRDIQHFGALSLAWKSYTELGVRNIMIEAASPLVFRSISCILPFAVPHFNTYQEIGRQLRFYREAQLDVAQHQDLALHHENYDQCIGMQDFLHELKASPVRWMLGLERRRIARLRGTAYDAIDSTYDPKHMPSPLSKTTRELWTLAPCGFTTQYVETLAIIDDITELSLCPAPEEPKYLDRLRIRRAKLIQTTTPTTDPSQFILEDYNTLLPIAEGMLAKTPTQTRSALEYLTQTLRVTTQQQRTQEATEPDADADGEVAEAEAETETREKMLLPTHTYMSHTSYKQEYLTLAIRLCRKAATRLGVKSEALAAERAASSALAASRERVKVKLEAVEWAEKDGDPVGKLPGSSREGEDGELVKKIIELSHDGEAGAKDFLRALVGSCRECLGQLALVRLGV